jgi:hypothetical protein
MNLTIKISDVPSEYQMLVLKYRSLLKTSIYFMEEFFKTLSFDDSRHVNDSINKVVGAQSMIKILFDNGTFCMPTIVIEDQEKFEHYRKQISF